MSNVPGESGNRLENTALSSNRGMTTKSKILSALAVLGVIGGIGAAAKAISGCSSDKTDKTVPTPSQTTDASSIELTATPACPPDKVCPTCKPVECGQGTLLNDAGNMCYVPTPVDAGQDAQVEDASTDASLDASIKEAGADAGIQDAGTDAGCTCPPPPKKKITTTTTTNKKLVEKTPPPAPPTPGSTTLDISSVANPSR